MTFILGGRAQDGVILAADTRTLGPGEYELGEYQSKIYCVRPNFLVASAGSGGLADKIVQGFQKLLEEKTSEKKECRRLEDLISAYDQALLWVWKDYAHRRPSPTSSLIAGLDERDGGKARLYHVGPESTQIEIGCEGSGGEGARYLVRSFWDSSLPMQELWPLAAYLICRVSMFDVSVGGLPEVHLVGDDIGHQVVPEDEVKRVVGGADSIHKGLKAYLRRRFTKLRDR